MKIAIDISQVVYEGSGVANYTAHLVEELTKDRTHQWLLFGYSWGRRHILKEFLQKYASLPHVTTKLISWPHRLINQWANIWHKINLEDLIGQFDILHTSDWVEFPSRNPKVTTIHDLVVYRYPQHLDKTIIETQRRKLNWVYKESRLIFADSYSTKHDIVKFLHINERKIQVVYLGVEEKFYKRDENEIERVKNKYKIAGEYLLFVGKREPRKNLDRLVKAFNQIKNNQYRLVIVGGIGWGDEIFTQQRMQILDFIEVSDLPGLYSGATCFIYPSLYEGFGLPVLEAMRCEVPVVTSNRGSLAEISHKSILVNPESIDSIASGLKRAMQLNPKKRREMTQKNLTWVKKFTWEKTAKEVIKGYESLF